MRHPKSKRIFATFTSKLTMNIQEQLTGHVKSAVQQLFNVTLDSVEFQATRKEFEGDITIVVFPMLRNIKEIPNKLEIRLVHIFKKMWRM